MVFSSYTFLIYFLPFTLLTLYILPHKYRNVFLLIMSLIFYMWSSPQYTVLMIVVIIITYYSGLYINKMNNINNLKKSKITLIISISFFIFILIIFKYFSFLENNLSSLFDSILSINWEIKDIALPVGISFYLFQSISYLIDVYRKDVAVQKGFKNLALYISMFPQLVAGPIVRYSSIVDSINNKRIISYNEFSLGLKIFILGLAKKVLIANQLAITADSIFSLEPSSLTTLAAWIGALAYSLQIYFDFSGYSDMAIGLGIMIGFKFPINFNYPYIAYSITDFWRRWHISLSSWFKDYVYIPLGGNRVKVSRMYLNLIIVFALTGIWHGANWTFLVWGLFHGLFLIIEKLTGLNKTTKYKFIRWFITMVIVIIGWVFFRSDNLSYAVDYLKIMFSLHNEEQFISFKLLMDYQLLMLFILSFIGSTPLIKKYIIPNIDAYKNITINKNLTYIQNIAILFLYFYIFILLAGDTHNPFIYFRF